MLVEDVAAGGVHDVGELRPERVVGDAASGAEALGDGADVGAKVGNQPAEPREAARAAGDQAAARRGDRRGAR